MVPLQLNMLSLRVSLIKKELNGRYEKNCNFASKPGDRSLPATVEFYSSRLLWSRRNHPAHNLQHKF